MIKPEGKNDKRFMYNKFMHGECKRVKMYDGPDDDIDTWYYYTMDDVIDNPNESIKIFLIQRNYAQTLIDKEDDEAKKSMMQELFDNDIFDFEGL